MTKMTHPRLDTRTGYEFFGPAYGDYVAIHHLLAIAEGENPHEVFANDTHIHHISGVPWDNRPDNIELLPVSEHAKRHYNGNQHQQPSI
jgi:hypothetical protein